MRLLPALLLVTTSACWSTAPAPDSPERLQRIAFGSCAKQSLPQPIWDTIAAHEPDLFLFLGDNVYADRPTVPERAEQIQAAYDALAAKETWQRFAASTPILATWDDHDYGKNDAGAEWELAGASQELLLRFFEEPEDSPRWHRKGVYDSRVFGPKGQRVQVLLLDTRTFRDPLSRRNRPEGAAGGPYGPGPGTVLGEAQWSWLEEELRVPADLRILCSSIQVVAEEHHWECWANFPAERERLLRLIDDTDAGGIVVLSGDRHLVELSRLDEAPYPLWDFTSSGLNETSREIDEPNRHRVGPVRRCTNFGLLTIDWRRRAVTLEGRDGEDQVLVRQELALRDLRE